jgi:hypothetical protein
MPAIDTFTPTGPTVNLAVTAGSASVTLTDIGHLGGKEVRVANAGTIPVFVNFGISDVAAATSNAMPVFAGTVEVFTVAPGATHCAAIATATGATVYFTTGRGA